MIMVDLILCKSSSLGLGGKFVSLAKTSLVFYV